MGNFLAALRFGLSSPYTRGQAYADQIDRLTTLEAAVRKIADAIPKYVDGKPKLTDRELANIVLEAVDNGKVIEALEGK